LKRKFERLLDDPFDLLVIGGGVYGAWIAYDATLRGLRVAIIEQEDWAAATSSASSKLIHGGLRYLEYRQFGLVRKTLEERRVLRGIAPHRVQSLRFALPIYSGASVGRLKLKAGLWLYDRLGGNDQPVRGHRSFSRAGFLERYPFLQAEGLKGGFTYGDAQTDDARFTLEIIWGAERRGAVAVNRTQATDLLREGSRVVGARVMDLETEASIDVRAALTINCAGPWVNRIIEKAVPESEPVARLSKGVHLVMPTLPTDDAFILLSQRSGRVVFLIPWYGRTLLGTTDTVYKGDPAHPRAEPRDIAYLLGEANRALGRGAWSESDIIHTFAGLRSLPITEEKATVAVTREWSLVESIEGLVTSVGGKYTSARVDAASAVDRALELTSRSPVPSETAETSFPWAPSEDYIEWCSGAMARGLQLGLDEETAAVCPPRYGKQIEKLFSLLEQRPGLARRIAPDAPFSMAEVLHAVQEEMARTLEDILRRRIPLMLVTRAPEQSLRDAAELAAEVLKWDSARRQAEVDSLFAHRRQRPRTGVS